MKLDYIYLCRIYIFIDCICRLCIYIYYIIMNYILQNTTLYVRTYMLEVIQLDLWIKINLFIYNNINIRTIRTQFVVKKLL